KRANFYVNHFAGGFSKENNKRQTVVVYPNGIVKKSINFGLFSLSPKVKKGSTIKVALKVDKQKKKNQNPIDWNQVIERAMLKTTAVLTVILMIDRLQP
ncbi:MAG: ligand-binding protein, partial [Flavobacteriales bacterium]|nr:ligand-binding protein [Flavobacteriales bacterium]